MKHNGIYQNLLICTVSLILVLFCQMGNAQTIEVSDNINNDTVWDADTVKILDDIIVYQGYTLTIKPGTYIEVQGHYKLEIQGNLLAIGTEDSNIIFTVNDTTLLHDLDTTKGGWNGIDFITSLGDTSKLVYCTLEYGKATDGQSTWNGKEDSGGSVVCYYNNPPVLIQYCTIRNSYGIAAGAVKIHQGNVIMLNNIVRDNKAKYCGGIDIGYSDGCIIGNTITNNFSTGNGGALLLDNTNGLFVNNLIVNNGSSGRPGGVYVNSASTSHSFAFFNNVIANNRTKSNCGGVYMSPPGRRPAYQNNIIWNNQTEGEYYQIYPDTVDLFRYNIIQGGYAGEGNIDTDPLFVNPTEGTGLQYDGAEADWSLQKISPCINAGKPDFTIDSTDTEYDFAGNPRIQYGRVDIGAFEITYCSPVIEEDAENILINGSFGTCDLIPWDLFSSGILSQPAGFRIIDGQCRVMPNGIDPQPEPEHIQLLQDLSESQIEMLVADSIYKLTFDARAESSNRSCRVFFGMNEEPFTAILDQDIILGTETESYSFEFTVGEIFPSIKLSFGLGSDSSAVTFDNVRIIKMPGEIVDNLELSGHHPVVIFPNPARPDDIMIDVSGIIKPLELNIVDINGRIIYKSDIIKARIIKPDVNIVAGIYIVRIKCSNTTYSKKFIIQEPY